MGFNSFFKIQNINVKAYEYILNMQIMYLMILFYQTSRYFQIHICHIIFSQPAFQIDKTTYSVWFGNVVAERPCQAFLWYSTCIYIGSAFSAVSSVLSFGNSKTIVLRDDASQCDSVNPTNNNHINYVITMTNKNKTQTSWETPTL